MRSMLSGRKVHRLREATGLDIVAATVRGDTAHDVVVRLRNGKERVLKPEQVPWLKKRKR